MDIVRFALNGGHGPTLLCRLDDDQALAPFHKFMMRVLEALCVELRDKRCEERLFLTQPLLDNSLIQIVERKDDYEPPYHELIIHP